MTILKHKISIKEARYKQEEFDKYLKQITIGNKFEQQQKTINMVNTNIVLSGINDATITVNGSSSMILQSKKDRWKKRT